MNTPKRGALLERREEGDSTLWRYLAADRERKLLYVLSVDRATSIMSSQSPVTWTYKEYIDGWGTSIKRVGDSVLLKVMGVSEGDLPTKDKDSRDEKLRLLGSLITGDFDSVVTSAAQRAGLISKRAAESGMSRSYISTLLTRYWWFGCKQNALLPLNARKGGPGVSRVGVPVQKTGRPNTHIKLYGDGTLKGVNVSRRHLVVFEKALRQFWVKCGYTLAATYDQMKATYFVGLNRLEGQVVAYPVRESKIPTLNQFRYHANVIINNLGLIDERASRETWEANRALSGNASDLCYDVLTVFDLDGTEFQCELVSDDSERRQIGKPVVLFAVDRQSTAIVGCYAWIGTESSRAYRYCIFDAFSSKKAKLHELGIGDLDGLVSGFCDSAYLDRGPGIAEPLAQTLLDQLHLTKAVARPGKGSDKGSVEGVMHIMQAKLSHVAGGYFENGSKAAQARARHARSNAALTISDFEKKLYEAISEFNLTSDARGHMTVEMRRTGTSPTPKDIFEFNQGKRVGDAALSWTDEEIYARLLDLVPVTLRRLGVRYNSATYRSNKAVALYEYYKKKHKTSVSIEVFPLPGRNHVLIWKEGEHEYSYLEMCKRDEARFGRSGWRQHTDAAQHDKARHIELQRGGAPQKRRGVVPRKHEALLADALALTHTLKKGKVKLANVKAARKGERNKQLLESGDRAVSMLGMAPPPEPMAFSVAVDTRFHGVVSPGDDSFDGFAE
jgi:hypothetical protein